jgi:hypothetical protein
MAREPDRDTIHCTLRLPDENLEARIKALAFNGERSFNAELVRLLKLALPLAEAGLVVRRSS